MSSAQDALSAFRQQWQRELNVPDNVQKSPSQNVPETQEQLNEDSEEKVFPSL